MKNVYFNHDGNVDDLVSQLVLMQVPDINITGISTVGADSYLTPSVSVSRKLIDLFGDENVNVEISASDSKGTHPFPSNWRLSTYAVDNLPLMVLIDEPKTKKSSLPAYLDIIRAVNEADGKTMMVFTGPLSDLAKALKEDPSIADKIESLYWMGGAIYTGGNVSDPESDGTPEWNAFWDAEAVKTVFDSSIEIHMVGLESTDNLPLTLELRQHWSKRANESAFDLVAEGYAMIQTFEADSTYYMWDVLTTLASQYPEIVKEDIIKADVKVGGMADGQTIETPNGRELHLVRSVDKDAFFSKFDELAERATKVHSSKN